MKPVLKAYVLLPAYNEETALSRLVPGIAGALGGAKRPFEIIIVNDGSQDGTSALIQSFSPEYAARELRHETNRGYGAALKTGFLWALQKAAPEDAVVSLDADRTHSPADIPRLLVKLEEGYDVVTASYFMKEGRAYGVPPLRRAMSRVVNRLFRLRVRIPGAFMYTSGFRAYRAAALQQAYAVYQDRLIEETGFPGGAELFLKIGLRWARAAEIPFDLHYEKRGSGSKIRLAQTVLRYLALLLRARQWR